MADIMAADCLLLGAKGKRVALWLLPGVVPELLSAAFREAAGDEGRLLPADHPALAEPGLLRVAAVRNPYARLAAMAEAAGTGLLELLAEAPPPGQAELLGGGAVAFDHVIHAEALGTDLPALLAELFGAADVAAPEALPGPPAIPRDAARRVRSLHAADFRLLGYPADRRFAAFHARRLRLPVPAGRGYRLAFGGPRQARSPDSPTFREAWQHIGAKRMNKGRMDFAAIARAGTGREAHRAFDAAAYCQMKGDGRDAGCDAFFARPGLGRFGMTPGLAYLAAQALWRGDWDRYWALVPQLPAWDPAWFGPWNRGLSTRVERGTCAGLDRMARAAPALPPQAGEAPVVLMAADRVYAAEHGEAALRSCRAAGEADIVLAVANPDPDLAERLQALAAELGGIELRLLGGLPEERAYYASLRYLIAPELMRTRRRPVFVFDIDILFRESAAAFFARTGQPRDRIGLRISPRYCYPWQRITVNSLYLPYGPEGLAFATHMRLFLEMQFSVPGSPDLWWIDQNAALSASVHAQDGAIRNLDVNGFVEFPRD
ncbi:hypothetical protein [Mangrovicoccus sp. HB161399]|uniref:hypothetical protein n=1 Tax=Mangrovicoccus sp. HB161399 TaxID=2720392 RepID=UPI001556A3F9|nr:hypothetical protein [Mangrovicoccus sp. HB161399]